tara:strand:+ start:12532 stop:13668 length:1137 start_codon:yes stop_codon:yes gene_type:complete
MERLFILLMESLMNEGYLILSDGSIFKGKIFGYPKMTYGEVVFNTSMTGYQEILTDPSYRGQIVIQTYPMIGNYGINDLISESNKIQVAGYVVRHHEKIPSHITSEITIDEFLKREKIIGISDLDTRSVVKKIRSKGVMNGVIYKGLDPEEGIKFLESVPSYDSLDLAEGVSNKESLNIKYGKSSKNSLYKIAVIDCGVKENILKLLNKRNCEIEIFSSNFDLEKLKKYNPDGILISPGPGDPKNMEYLVEKITNLTNDYPMFGICLGHQILARSFGANTFKLKFGHRGGNQPVKDLISGKVYITAQNHGYAVEAKGISNDLEITHVNLNDETVSGIKHKKLPIMGIQYHSEASPGPYDNEYIFDEFINLINSKKDNN